MNVMWSRSGSKRREKKAKLGKKNDDSEAGV
jgi:hypothetical protein